MNEVSNTYGYTSKMLEHVFWGEIQPDGSPAGFHCNRAIGDEKADIDSNTKEMVYGNVYKCKVKSKYTGIEKMSNHGFSTFFPDGFTRQQILDCIAQAQVIQSQDSLYLVTLGGDDIYIKIYRRGGNIVTIYPVNIS